MSKTLTAMGLAVTLVAGIAGAQAQTTATTPSTMSNTPSTAPATTTTTSPSATAPNAMRASSMNAAPAPNGIQADQIRSSKIVGSAVYDVQNRKIGKVSDLILDKDGKVANVVLDVGSFLGMGGKYVAVMMSDIKTDNNRLTLDRSKEQLQQMGAYSLRDTNTGAGTSASPVHGGQLGTRAGH